ncbi:MAG: UDP-glucose 4-epimerase GalE [Chlamydiota bacterium]
MTKNVLVTGGAGYIGSHTCKALAQAGFVPITYDNLSLGHRWAVKWGPFINGDIGDRTALAAACARYRPIGIIHFAALSNVRESEKKPLEYFETNFAGTLNALTVAKKEHIRYFVFSSSCAVYGIPDQAPIRETSPRKPISTYGRSKALAEDMLATSGLCSAVLRYFNAAGADPDGEIGESHTPETHLLPLALETALKKRNQFTLYGIDHPTSDGTAIRDFIHVSDLAQGHVQALKWLIEHNQSLTLNLGTGHGYSVKEVIRSIESHLKTTLPLKVAPAFPGDPPILVADNAQAIRILNWSFRYSSLDQIITTALRWHR